MIDAPLGQVFTPPRLAHRLWSQAVAVLDAVSSGAGRTPLRVIEPAAGDGALVRVGREALRARDVNGVAIELDRACIPALRAAAGPWTVLHADALTLVAPDAPVSDMGARAGAMSPAEVAARVPWVPAAGSADLIVANPPWVRETGHSALFRALRRWHSGHYAAACPRNADLSHVFIARIVDWLRPGGVAAVLMPAYWMDTDVGAHVRRRLASQGRIVSAWRAHDVRWFDGVSVEASFFVWQKGAAPQQTAVLAADAAEVAHRISLPEPSCAWTLRVPVEIPSAATEPLGDHWRVIEGVSTAANRLRARDVERVCRGRVGEGIFVLHDDEVEAAGSLGTGC